MATTDRSSLGHAGEDAALASYRARGFRLVARNWRCRFGEIDLVLARGPTIVFCEVKTRATAVFGPPFEAVTSKKQQKLKRLAEAFLLAGVGRVSPDSNVRFDVASVSVGPSGRTSVHVFDDAF
jgi:putative endonuclease